MTNEREEYYYYRELLRTGEIRLVGTQRKRKLRKRGVNVRWCAELGGFIWCPKESK